MKNFKFLALLLAGLTTISFATTAMAADDIHRLVIQVSTDDPRTQKIAVNNAVNVLKDFEPGQMVVEIVAYGPGLSLLTKKSKQAKRIEGLALNDDLTFSACNNTMKKIEKKKGKKPVLIEGVKVVPAGVSRIMELQEKGYAYIRP